MELCIVFSKFQKTATLCDYSLQNTVGMDIAERRKPQDGRIRVRLYNEPVDLRVSSVPTSFGEKIVLRILRSKLENLSFEKLELPDLVVKKLKNGLEQKGKLILVTGPTGSGKTTTLYSCLNFLRDGTTNIETVEDPIEYRIPGIHQIQVNNTAGVSFASALRSVLRQDPDVIMIGEIRDQETAEIALQAAQTGHQVLSTLHTNSASAAITRLSSIGIDPFVLSSCVSTIVAQRLLRKICNDCKVTAGQEFLERHADIISDYNLDYSKIFEPTGCQSCNHTGYKGRVGIYSLLEINDEIADLILTKASLNKILEAAKQNGFKTLTEAAFDRLEEGLTTLDEVRPYYLAVDDGQISEVIDPTAPSPSKHKSLNIKKDSGSITREKVVLIEDDEDVRRILTLLLQKEMYEVIEAENGLVGLNAVYEHQPTFVLCDLMMPVMDGKEFLIKMQNNTQTTNIPVIILTAADNEDNETGLLDLGAADFVSKSSSSSVMLSRLRRILTTL
ncbi:MAG: type II/IV secretion system protein [Bdellovibrionota bacterium]